MAETLGFDELNVLEADVDEMVEDIGGIIEDPNRTAIIADIEDDLEELLIMAYVFGQDYVNRTLDTDIKADTQKIQDAVFQKIDGKDWRDRIRQHIEDGDLGMVQTVIRTETERVYNEAVLDLAEESGEPGLKKTWETMADDRVRDAHTILHGVKVPIDSYFWVDGARALAPHGFGVPELDCNCRCRLRISK